MGGGKGGLGRCKGGRMPGWGEGGEDVRVVVGGGGLEDPPNIRREIQTDAVSRSLEVGFVFAPGRVVYACAYVRVSFTQVNV